MSDLPTVLPRFSMTVTTDSDSGPAWYTYSLLPALERHRITVTDLLTLEALEIARRASVPILDVRRFVAEEVVQALRRDVGVDDNNDGVGEKEALEVDGKGERNCGGRGQGPGWNWRRWDTVSLLDERLDGAVGGGIPTGYVTEITGESAAGKTQFLLTLLLSVQLPPPHGLSRNSIYISTEAPLSTTRLAQLLDSHPRLCTATAVETTTGDVKQKELDRSRPSLDRILAIPVLDLESQDHILTFQLPDAVRRFDVGLVVVDSVAANYRAEHGSTSPRDLANRAAQLARLGYLLRELAKMENVAVVVANQVSDRFVDDEMFAEKEDAEAVVNSSAGKGAKRKWREEDQHLHPLSSSPMTATTISSSSSPPPPSLTAATPKARPIPRHDGNRNRNRTAESSSSHDFILSLDFQQRFFTGWGDDDDDHYDDHPSSSFPQLALPPTLPRQDRHGLKTPALGLTWANQIACRIALKMYERDQDQDEDEEEAEAEQEEEEEESHPPPLPPHLHLDLPHPSRSPNNDTLDTEPENEPETINAPAPALAPASPTTTDTNTTLPSLKQTHTPKTKNPVRLPNRTTTTTTRKAGHGHGHGQKRRFFKLVFAPWAPPTPDPDPGLDLGPGPGVEFTIQRQGVFASSSSSSS